MDFSWMFEEYDGIVYVSDIDNYELLYMNKKCKETLHLSQDILSKNPRCYEVLQGRDSPCPFCTNSYLKEDSFYRWEFYNPLLQRTLLLKDRKFIWNGRNTRIEFATDVSDYRKAINSYEHQRKAILQALPGGIVRVDARDGRSILWYGARFLEMIGYTAEQFENELHSQCTYVHPDDLPEVAAMMESLRGTDKSGYMEARIVTRSGEVRTLAATFTYGDGDASADGIPSFYSVGIDITESRSRQALQQKALEDACRTAREADRAKTDFLSKMSHDIRTPLNAILGMAEIAETRRSDPRAVGDCLKKIQASGRHLLNLINEVLDMSKIESGQMRLAAEDMDLSELVRDVLDVCGPLLKEKEHSLRVRADIVHEAVRCDAGRLQQLLTNLLANAVKYTPAGGEISLLLREGSSPRPDMGLFEFTIEDNGIGMSEDFIVQAFEPFQRADDPRIGKIQGTGLGLTISRNIARLMGGSISVSSNPGKGSSFAVSLTLPLAEEKNMDYGPPLAGPVLVLLEDRQENQRACRLLEDLGLRSMPAYSAAEGLAQLKSHMGEKSFAAVVVDQRLAEKASELSPTAIRSGDGPCPPRVILLRTPLHADEFTGNPEGDGVDAFLDRPLFRRSLCEALRPDIQTPVSGETSGTDVSLTGKRILLAEDNDINREIVVQLLGMKGAVVDEAEDGQSALEMFTAAAPGTYDLILMDIRMPRRDGYETAAAIRAQDRPDARSVPILALTAEVFPEDVLLVKKYGMNEHIPKPVAVEHLYQTIRHWLDVKLA